jgi:Protein of unknown function (DUF3987)
MHPYPLLDTLNPNSPPRARTPRIDILSARLSELLSPPQAFDEFGRPRRERVELSAGARTLWGDYRDEVAATLTRTERPNALLDAIRAADTAAHIAAVLHYFEGRTGPIRADVMTKAVSVARRHLTASLRPVAPPLQADATVLIEWLIDFAAVNGRARIPISDIQLRAPNHLRNKESLRGLVRVKRSTVNVDPALLGERLGDYGEQRMP